MLEPKEGLLTFRAEGDNYPGSRYYSRKIHWPGNSAGCARDASGVTIGRGFDLGNRTKAEAYSILIMAGIPPENARKIANGAGLKYCQVEKFVRSNERVVNDITEKQQLDLFEIIYPDYLNRARRFYYSRKGKDAVSWDNLNQALKDVFVDMFYQGRLEPGRVKCFEKNSRNDVILFIKSNQQLSKDEIGRNRIGYLIKEGKG